MADVAWTTWTVDLPAIVGLGGVTTLYLRGYLRRRASGTAQPRRLVAFATGAAIVLAAVVSPIAAAGEHLLWAHMIQHLLLVVVAAPLFAFSAPAVTIRRGLDRGPRHALARAARTTRRIRRRSGNVPPLVLATISYVTVLWAWHVPGIYDLAVDVDAIHALEHVLFLSTAVWFWSEVVATAKRGRRNEALATLCLAALIVQGGVLGALLTFAGRSVYDVYTGGGGLTALEDQQFAGALMWVPPSFVYATVAVRRFIAWIEEPRPDDPLRDDGEGRRSRPAASPRASGS